MKKEVRKFKDEQKKRRVARGISAGVLTMAMSLSSVAPVMADTDPATTGNDNSNSGNNNKEHVGESKSEGTSEAKSGNEPTKESIDKVATKATEAKENASQAVQDNLDKVSSALSNLSGGIKDLNDANQDTANANKAYEDQTKDADMGIAGANHDVVTDYEKGLEGAETAVEGVISDAEKAASEGNRQLALDTATALEAAKEKVEQAEAGKAQAEANYNQLKEKQQQVEGAYKEAEEKAAAAKEKRDALIAANINGDQWDGQAAAALAAADVAYKQATDDLAAATAAKNQADSDLEAAKTAKSNADAALLSAINDRDSLQQTAGTKQNEYNDAETAFAAYDLEALSQDLQQATESDQAVHDALTQDIDAKVQAMRSTTNANDFWPACRDLMYSLVKYNLEYVQGATNVEKVGDWVKGKKENGGADQNYQAIKYTDKDGVERIAYFDYVAYDKDGTRVDGDAAGSIRYNKDDVADYHIVAVEKQAIYKYTPTKFSSKGNAYMTEADVSDSDAFAQTTEGAAMLQSIRDQQADIAAGNGGEWAKLRALLGSLVEYKLASEGATDIVVGNYVKRNGDDKDNSYLQVTYVDSNGQSQTEYFDYSEGSDKKQVNVLKKEATEFKADFSGKFVGKGDAYADENAERGLIADHVSLQQTAYNTAVSAKTARDNAKQALEDAQAAVELAVAAVTQATTDRDNASTDLTNKNGAAEAAGQLLTKAEAVKEAVKGVFDQVKVALEGLKTLKAENLADSKAKDEIDGQMKEAEAALQEAETIMESLDGKLAEADAAVKTALAKTSKSKSAPAPAAAAADTDGADSGDNGDQNAGGGSGDSGDSGSTTDIPDGPVPTTSYADKADMGSYEDFGGAGGTDGSGGSGAAGGGSAEVAGSGDGAGAGADSQGYDNISESLTPLAGAEDIVKASDAQLTAAKIAGAQDAGEDSGAATAAATGGILAALVAAAALAKKKLHDALNKK